MRENGIHARRKRRYKPTTDSGHGLPVAANVLDRQFTPRAPNREPLRDPRGGHGEAFDYIEVLYNRKRRHCSLGYRLPVQCLEHWLTTEEGQKRGA